MVARAHLRGERDVELREVWKRAQGVGRAECGRQQAVLVEHLPDVEVGRGGGAADEKGAAARLRASSRRVEAYEQQVCGRPARGRLCGRPQRGAPWRG
eukprot:193694-Chlamydomonas_euryale.AAC.1